MRQHPPLAPKKPNHSRARQRPPALVVGVAHRLLQKGLGVAAAGEGDLLDHAAPVLNLGVGLVGGQAWGGRLERWMVGGDC
jgi:hypothetical protein